jgi:hypothetical protein
MDDQQPNSEETTNLSTQYQSILDKYASDLAVKTPEPAVPPRTELPQNLPIVETPIVPVASTPAPESNGFFKILFFISLILFLGVLGANVYTFFIAKPSVTSQNTPTLTPVPTESVQTQVCELNDAKYQVGQTFTAQDGCNTCTCQSDKTISCTSEICPTAGPTKKPVPISVTSVFPTSGKFGDKITIYGTGFDKTKNSVSLVDKCTFTYHNVVSDGQKIKLDLITPSEIKCNDTGVNPTPTSPVQLVAGDYMVVVYTANSSSYKDAKIIKFKLQ